MEETWESWEFDGLQFGGTVVLGNPRWGNVRPVIGTRRGGLGAQVVVDEGAREGEIGALLELSRRR